MKRTQESWSFGGGNGSRDRKFKVAGLNLPRQKLEKHGKEKGNLTKAIRDHALGNTKNACLSSSALLGRRDRKSVMDIDSRKNETELWDRAIDAKIGFCGRACITGQGGVS